MKEKIQKILERELAKLDALSLATPEPLSSNDIRSLDTLIKAHRSFIEPTPAQSGSAQPAESDPALQSTADLINDITSQTSPPIY